ncbi:MAG: hypothetical protein ACK5O2_15085 [Microthrixaceae bacterium]
MSRPDCGALGELIKAVARLALPADTQLRYLRELKVLPGIDELALELHDRAVLLRQFVENGWLSSREADFIQALDEALARLSERGPELWSETALKESPEWEEVRERARVALIG